MRSPVNNFILNWLRPRLTMATTGTVVQQGTSGNYATDGQKDKEDKEEKQGGISRG